LEDLRQWRAAVLDREKIPQRVGGIQFLQYALRSVGISPAPAFAARDKSRNVIGARSLVR
jgi:hypothetical protein